MEMYALWEHAGEMAGDPDRLLGIYPDYVSARESMIDFAHCTCDYEDVYITKMEVGKAYIFKFPEYPDFVGEVV